ncbi:MAG TPA: hypothetical protein VFB07_05110, partial [Vicinamibacterales bacterium]|nr:hypothetical protein [Vicinamibacterales bacterium]
MTFDDDLKRAFDALSDRLHAEVQHQIDAAMAELRAAAPPAVEPPPPPPPPEPPPAVQDTTVPDLAAAMRQMDEARSLTDVLDALTSGAARQSR